MKESQLLENDDTIYPDMKIFHFFMLDNSLAMNELSKPEDDESDSFFVLY